MTIDTNGWTTADIYDALEGVAADLHALITQDVLDEEQWAKREQLTEDYYDLSLAYERALEPSMEDILDSMSADANIYFE